ncbi:hypothetical protein BH11MYX4_BH11MYX4_58750 [soil metagenome]
MRTFANLTLILHPTDLSGAETSAFVHALRLSVASGAELHLLNVAGGASGAAVDAFSHAGPILERWRSAGPHGGLLVTKSVERERGLPVEQLRQFVELERPDLVVLSPHQRQGLARVLHPSVSQAFAAGALAMTLFVPREGRPFVDAGTGEVSLRRIVVPVARVPAAEPAVEAALGLARLLGCGPLHLTLLHVGQVRDFPGVVVPAVDASVTVERVSLGGNVVDGIVECCAGADLVVMTTEGRVTMLDQIRGATTENILRRASCPVLAVPAV